MPTGYTADVQDGKITTLREYAMRCIGAFLIESREGTLGDKLPSDRKADTSYDDNGIADATAELTILSNMTADEINVACDAAFAESKKCYDDRIKTRNEQRERYQTMLDKVMAWQPPAACDNLKNFMMSQLTQSIRYDCGPSWSEDPPINKSPEEWLKNKKESASWSLDYHTKQRADKIAAANERNLWLNTVRVAFADLT